MEYFMEGHAALMLGVEWLVKVDPDLSKSYLFKYVVDGDGKFCLMITDTEHLWAEVLSPQQFARRWAVCNSSSSLPVLETSQSRNEALRLVSAAHTVGGIGEMNFTFSESPTCDARVSLECDTGSPATSWSWRWETFSTGPKISARILSQHLIMPLISSMHLSFQSIDPVNGMSDADLEKAVDKMARTARRAIDTHVKQAVSKPRHATALRRITAMLQDVKLLPIVSEAEDTDLTLAHADASVHPAVELTSARLPRSTESPQVQTGTPSHPASIDTRETISVDDSPPPRPRGKLVRRNERHASPVAASPRPTPSASLVLNNQATENDIEMKGVPSGSETEDSDHEILVAPAMPSNTGANSLPLTGSSSTNPPPSKKVKAASSSDDDSESERKQHVARMVASSKRGGARQPLQRGGKRF